MSETYHALLPSRSARKRNTIILLVMAMAFSPIVAGFFPDNLRVGYFFMFLISLIVYFWCRFDAAEMGKKIPWLISAAILIVLTIGFPIYLVRLKRFPMGKAISITFFWILLYMGIFYSSAYLMYFAFG